MNDLHLSRRAAVDAERTDECAEQHDYGLGRSSADLAGKEVRQGIETAGID